MKTKGILTVFLVVLLLNCSGTDPDKASVNGENPPGSKPLPLVDISVCLERPYFTSFLPYELTFLNDTHVYTIIYNTLATTDHSGRLMPELAERWTVSPDFREYKFTLKKNVFFHNGKRLSVKDVIFSFEQLVLNSHKLYTELTYIEGADAFIRGESETLSGLIQTGPHRFTIKLTKRFKYFLHFLSSGMTAIIPDNFGGKSREEFMERPIGTGPFRLESMDEVTVGMDKFKEFRFVASENYFLETGNIRRLTLSLPLSDVKQLVQLLRFDIFSKSAVDNKSKLLGDRRIINGSYDIAVFLAINPAENRWVKNREFRQLVNYSINREQMVGQLKEGNYLPAHTIYPVNLFGHHPHYRVDYKNAGRLVQKIPKKGDPGFTLLVYPDIKVEAEFIKAALAAREIRVDIHEVAQEDYFRIIDKPGQTDYSLITKGAADYPCPYNLLIQLYGSGGALNNHNIQSKEIMDQILTLPLVEVKTEVQRLRTIDIKGEKESYYIPLYFLSNTLVLKNRIKKITFKYPSIINYSTIEVNDE